MCSGMLWFFWASAWGSIELSIPNPRSSGMYLTSGAAARLNTGLINSARGSPLLASHSSFFRFASLNTK